MDLKNIGADDFELIHRAWLDHLVLLFRGQQLNDEDLIAFSRRFGELDWAPVQETGRRFVEGHPEIYVVSNVIENGAADRQPRRGRSGVAHRHVVSGDSAQGEHAVRAGSSSRGRQYLLLQHVRGL